jgi:ADP-ribosylglycohydrolase
VKYNTLLITLALCIGFSSITHCTQQTTSDGQSWTFATALGIGLLAGAYIGDKIGSTVKQWLYSSAKPDNSLKIAPTNNSIPTDILQIRAHDHLASFTGIAFTKITLPKARCASCFAGCMLAGGIGDALGRVTKRATKFITSPDGIIQSKSVIFQRYPHGVQSYDDFLPSDWTDVPSTLKNKKIAPYTEDTAMAILVMKELIKAQKQNWDLNKTMCNIALSFIRDAQDTTLGWMAQFRTYRKTCIDGVKKLSINFEKHKDPCHVSPPLWMIDAPTADGCDSARRAHPFGLAFANDPETAAFWAAKHSNLTHGNSKALAACAAMATGVAYAVQGKDVEFIVEKMAEAAKIYNIPTARKIESAYSGAQHAQKLKKPFSDIFQAYKNHAFQTFNNRIFNTFNGWTADDAIAAAVYVFALSPDNIMEAIYLGVHTPGDSDSIASMAGALVGARVGVEQIPQKLIDQLENSAELKSDALKLADIIVRNQ